MKTQLTSLLLLSAAFIHALPSPQPQLSTLLAPSSPQSEQPPPPLDHQPTQEELDRDRSTANIEYEYRMKYFHEPTSHEVGADDRLGHYDSRYFSRMVTEAEKTETQIHMVKAYLETFARLGIETWLAHGTLLGWWWNGKILPWDWDIDTQLSESTLLHLGAEHNMTTHNWVDPTTAVARTYLLDINAHARERTNGNGFNIIDARWIDTSTGLYIDITALSELSPSTAPGVVSCKNFHNYSTADIYPLRETVFHGVRAQVPFRYTEILKQEYGAASMSETVYNGHEWSKSRKEWRRIEGGQIVLAEA